MLDYLHENKILCRNLNPEHILVDNKGYPNLFDFKLAKKLISETNFKTSTLIGSPHYFSPEMIQKKPYSFSTDYWQLGVIMY
jgi:serine/threonine protein kinase